MLHCTVVSLWCWKNVIFPYCNLCPHARDCFAPSYKVPSGRAHKDQLHYSSRPSWIWAPVTVMCGGDTVTLLMKASPLLWMCSLSDVERINSSSSCRWGVLTSMVPFWCVNPILSSTFSTGRLWIFPRLTPPLYFGSSGSHFMITTFA